MLNENRFLDTFRGHNIRPNCFVNSQVELMIWTQWDTLRYVTIEVENGLKPTRMKNLCYDLQVHSLIFTTQLARSNMLPQ